MKLFLESASTIAPQVDRLTLALGIFSLAILGLVFGLILFFVIRYRRDRHPRARPGPTSTPIEIGWTLALMGISLGLFAWGAILYVKEHVIPPGAITIYGVGKQWMWKFQHPSGRQELDELHVPVGTPVRLVLVSQDVIHSVFIPAFRIKQDVLPGRYSELSFQPTRVGEYPLLCTQYCGLSHSAMTAKVVALAPDAFARWLSGGSGSERSGGGALASRGREHFTRYGCISCHGSGSAVRAPDLAGVYGSWVGLRSGGRIFADESYLRESIVEPNAKIVQGYEAIMPSFRNQISEDELNELVEYVKSLANGPARAAREAGP